MSFKFEQLRLNGTASVNSMLIVALTVAAVACGGGDSLNVDADSPDAPASDAPAIDSSSATFHVTTHSLRWGPARARLVAFRDGQEPWVIAAETAAGEYSGTLQGATIDIVIVCTYPAYNTVDAQFLHLAATDVLDVSYPCMGENSLVHVSGTVVPVSRVHFPRVVVTGTSDIDIEERRGPGDVIAVSPTSALIVHDIAFSEPTVLDLNVDTEGSPLGPLDLSVIGATPAETLSLRSGVTTKNGTAIAVVSALIPRAQLRDGDVRRVYGLATTTYSSRSITAYSNDDAARVLTLPTSLNAASFQHGVGFVDEWRWTGVFAENTGIEVSAVTGYAAGGGRGFYAYTSARRLAFDGQGDDGVYRIPERDAIPGWQADWELLETEASWLVRINGANADSGFGATPVPGDIRWTASMTGLTGTPPPAALNMPPES